MLASIWDFNWLRLKMISAFCVCGYHLCWVLCKEHLYLDLKVRIRRHSLIWWWWEELKGKILHDEMFLSNIAANRRVTAFLKAVVFEHINKYALCINYLNNIKKTFYSAKWTEGDHQHFYFNFWSWLCTSVLYVLYDSFVSQSMTNMACTIFSLLDKR